MFDLPLSEALVLGGLMEDHPAVGDVNHCGIGMVLQANDAVPDPDNIMPPTPIGYMEDCDEQDDETDWLTMRAQEWKSGDWWVTAEWHRRLLEGYPWIKELNIGCPWCRESSLKDTELLHHPFDKHVMTGEITLDALAAWIATIEPPPPPPRLPPLDIGMAARFRSPEERVDVNRAADRLGATLNAYITAAIRAVLGLGLHVRHEMNDEDWAAPGLCVTIYLQDAAEKAAVLDASRQEGLGWADFNGAAVRLAMNLDLAVRWFLREGPNTADRDVLYGPVQEARRPRPDDALLECGFPQVDATSEWCKSQQ
jgi:hypothetical protein